MTSLLPEPVRCDVGPEIPLDRLVTIVDWVRALWSDEIELESAPVVDFCQLVPTKNAPTMADAQIPWTVTDLEIIVE